MDTNENNKTMKTQKMFTRNTALIIAAALVLQMNSIFAEENSNKSTRIVKEAGQNMDNDLLRPLTPMVASFEDADILSDGAPVTEISIISLAPVTPLVADFDDEETQGVPAATLLAPVTPSTADFCDQQ